MTQANPFRPVPTTAHIFVGGRVVLGTVFLNHCPLYWDCRFAGYGNKLPSK